MITLASKSKFEAEIKQLKEALATKETAFVKLSEDFEAVKTELTEIKNKPQAEDPRIAELNAKIETLTKENETLKASVSEFQTKVSEAANDLVAAQGVAPIKIIDADKVDQKKSTGFGNRIVFTRNQ